MGSVVIDELTEAVGVGGANGNRDPVLEILAGLDLIVGCGGATEVELQSSIAKPAHREERTGWKHHEQIGCQHSSAAIVIAQRKGDREIGIRCGVFMLKAERSCSQRIGSCLKWRTITPIHLQEFGVLRTDVGKGSGESDGVIWEDRRADGYVFKGRRQILNLDGHAVRGAAGLVRNNRGDRRAGGNIVEIAVRERERRNPRGKICGGNDAAVSPLD